MGRIRNETPPELKRYVDPYQVLAISSSRGKYKYYHVGFEVLTVVAMKVYGHRGCGAL
jgi:hypothetical protein